MSERYDLDRELRTHYQDVPELPRSVLDEALDRAALTRQRRFGWIPVIRARTTMAMIPAVGALALAFVAVVLVGLLMEGPDSTAPMPAASPISSPSASVIVVAEDDGGDVSSIAAALDRAADGDTVLIRPGTYVGGVVVEQDITIRGDGPPSEIVVTATRGSPTVDLDERRAYAFLTDGSDATIRDLTLRNAGADAFAPIVAVGGAPVFEGLDAGGSIWLTDRSAAVVRGNRIAGVTTRGGQGGAEIGDNDTAYAPGRIERALTEGLAPLSCGRWREPDEPFTFGSSAAVRCPDPAPRVSQLAVFSFPDEATLDRYWDWRVADLGLDGGTVQGACSGRRQGARGWQHGSIACYIPDEPGAVAKIRWTDRRDSTYGVMDATDTNMAALHRQWQRLVRD